MLIPYYATIVREETKLLLTIYYVATLLYTIDILVQICTNIDDSQSDSIHKDNATDVKGKLSKDSVYVS